ncbi:uroporphyrinogen-III C-methyltransferase [Shewanella youngdeokensis]|uniref:Uroporphyrinogen-III C-methyltransferase n=1 Tax=Shewanella youngdeokensis TaxID=2999068 RepID=A0ABZ0JX66_9GAMM|nr:uroporphyrinogen-III C-methyltransferase [Shewanella sp. DAU334]
MENKHTDASTVELPQADTTSAQPVNDTPPTPEASLAPPVVNEDPVKQESSAPWGIIFILFLLLIFAFVTAAGGYYFYQQLEDQKSQSAALVQKLQADIAKPNQRIDAIVQQQNQFKANIETALSTAKTEQTQLQERVSILAQRNPNHWRAEEAKYLVRLAGQKLWLEKDPSTATSLLKAADDRIKSMRDTSLMPLRKALAKDIAATASIKTTDITGTVLTLDTLITGLDTLPLNRAETHFSAVEPQDTQVSESLDDWQANLTKSWKALIDDFVVVRKRTTDTAPLLEPDQQWYLVENTRNKLLQAQLALYRQDQVNYRNSVKLARKWIYQYFDLKDPLVSDALATLDALETLKIQTASIDRFDSSNLLNQLVTYGNLMTEEAQ